MSGKDPYRSAINKAAALTRVSQVGGAAVSAPARRAFLDRFLDEVDPNRTLAESERERRAQAARRAYFTKLAAKSARARKAKANKAATNAEAANLRALADAIEAGELA